MILKHNDANEHAKLRNENGNVRIVRIFVIDSSKLFKVPMSLSE